MVPLGLQFRSIFAEACTAFKFQEMKPFLLFFPYSSVARRKFHSNLRANIGYRIECFTITMLGVRFHSRRETLNALSECICNTREAMIMSGIEVPQGNVSLITSCFSQHTIKHFFSKPCKCTSRLKMEDTEYLSIILLHRVSDVSSTKTESWEESTDFKLISSDSCSKYSSVISSCKNGMVKSKWMVSESSFTGISGTGTLGSFLKDSAEKY